MTEAAVATKSTQTSSKDPENRVEDPTPLDGHIEESKSVGTYATKIPPDHPGLRLERPQPRILRRGPALAAIGLLTATVCIAFVVAFSPRAASDPAATTAPSSDLAEKQIQISEAVEKVPGNDAPLRQVPKLGPAVQGEQGREGDLAGAAAGPAGDRAARQAAVRDEQAKALQAPILADLENPTSAEQPQPPPPNGASSGAGAAAPSARPVVPEAMPGALSSSDPNLQQRKNDFLAHDGAGSSAYVSEAPTLPRSPYEVKAGTIIPTTLITGIDSDLPGQIIGQVRENVYDTVTGNYLLIPQGSRLIATYDSMVGFGQERVLVCWNRLIRPDGLSIGLECMPGVDLAGYAGFADQVDNHWWRILSGVALGTLLSATAQRSQGDVSGFQPTFPQLWASNVANSLNTAGQQLTQKNLQIQPTLKVRPGFTVNVLVSKDIIVGPYRPGGRLVE
jgi:type IV secretion system protein VirB10